MTHYMIDIETTDTLPTAKVLAIAVTKFDEENIQNTLVLYPKHEDQEQRTADMDTMIFWMGYQDTFKSIMSQPQQKVTTCLAKLHVFMGKKDENIVWAKSPSFDLAILKNLFGETNLPWIHRNERDVRTAQDKVLQRNIPLVKSKILHDPLADAIAQTKNVQNFLKL